MVKLEKIKNHRFRVRQKLKNNLDKGNIFSGFADYEILEFLLFYIFRQGDTKPIAKNLLNKFGSLSNVLDASITSLQSVDGMGPDSAFSLISIRNIFSFYSKDKSYKIKINNTQDILDLLKITFGDKENEFLFILFLDNNNQVTNTFISDAGSSNSINFNIRNIIEYSLKYNASSIVVSHNHPGGKAIPSNADIVSTSELSSILNKLDISIFDHLIIAENQHYSFLENSLL